LLFPLGARLQPAAGLHPLVQYSDDLDQVRLNQTEIENVHRSAYVDVAAARARMSEVKPAQPVSRGSLATLRIAAASVAA